MTSCERPLTEVWRSSALAAAFLAGDSRLAGFYRYRPDPDGYLDALAARREQELVAPRSEMVDSLRSCLSGLEPSAAQEANLNRLLEPDCTVVVTGQQPGLLGGPLYALHKALTAVHEARRRSLAGQPTVPLFWMATEDDDWAEVASTTSINERDELIRLALPHRPAEGTYVGSVPLVASDLEALWQQVAEALPAGEAATWLSEQLPAWLGPSQTMGDLFRRLWQALLGPLGLLLLDPTNPAVRALMAPLNARLLADPLAPTRLADEAGQHLRTLGFEPATHRNPDLCAFYIVDQGVRHRLVADGPGYVTDHGVRYDARDLAALAEQPERISHSVLLRPVAEDYLLPTATLVVGPGEISYAAQIGPVYDHLGIARPHLMPRRSLCLAPPAAARQLRRYGLRPCDLQDTPEQLLAQVVRANEGQESDLQVRAAQQAAAAAIEPLRSHAAEVDPTLVEAGAKLVNRLTVDLANLGTKLQRAHRRQAAVHLRRLSAARAWLAPGGQPQERALGLLPLLAVAGPALVERVDHAVQTTSWDRQGVVELFGE